MCVAYTRKAHVHDFDVMLCLSHSSCILFYVKYTQARVSDLLSVDGEPEALLRRPACANGFHLIHVSVC